MSEETSEMQQLNTDIKQEDTNNININIQQLEEAKLIATIIEQKQLIETFQGPIPHPDILKGYEETLKGSANRIIAMAENQASHRFAIEQQELKLSSRDSLLGIVCAFTLCIFLISIGAALCFYSQHIAGQISGTLMSGGGIALIANTFLKNTNRQDKK